MASATLYSPSYATARRGGLRGAGGISTEARITANVDRGLVVGGSAARDIRWEASHKGCYQARLPRHTGAHRGMAWLARVCIGFTSWRTVPLLFSSWLAFIGALDRALI
jgi:hypothetical protein